MAELPDDALRCICEQLVPPRLNEEFMAEAQVYCDEHTTDAALSASGEERLREVYEECEYLQGDMRQRIREWKRERGPVAVQLRLVSKDWRRAREKPTNDLK